jgi:hypothetical protein
MLEEAQVVGKPLDESITDFAWDPAVVDTRSAVAPRWLRSERSERLETTPVAPASMSHRPSVVEERAERASRNHSGDPASMSRSHRSSLSHP